MWFRVASLLGDTVENLRRTMSYKEFIGWCAFYRLQPWGFDADNFHSALISCTVDNAKTTYKRRTKWSKVEDFLVSNNNNKKKVISADELIAQLKTSGFGGKIIDKRNA